MAPKRKTQRTPTELRNKKKQSAVEVEQEVEEENSEISLGPKRSDADVESSNF